MPSVTDSYRVSARYYDGAYSSMQDLVDVPFYLELARESGGPVLEIGCGTGRVLIPTAREGLQIHGVDNSAPMLGILREKLAREDASVRSRVCLHSGDMRDFRLHRQFPLVTIPFRPLQHMFTPEDQLKALHSAAAHVADGGWLAFDVFQPKFDRLMRGIGEEMLEVEWSPAPDTTIRRFYRKDAIDRINQNFTLTFLFRTFRHGELVAEEAETLKMSFYTYPHLRALFLLAGLEPVEEYGSFAKDRLDNDAEEMIFLLRRAR